MDAHETPQDHPDPSVDAVQLGADAARNLLPLFSSNNPYDPQALGEPTPRELTDMDTSSANDLAHEQEVKHLTAERDYYKLLAEENNAAKKILIARVATAEREAMYDSDTGLPNKRGLEVIYDQLVTNSRRQGDDLSLLFVDLDHFKDYNTTLGHLKTDDFVVVISDILRRSLREDDIIGRFGGDEFIIFLPSTDVEAARQVADKLRENVKIVDAVEGHKVTPTLSVGVDKITGDKPFKEAVEPANQALRMAKAKGRDQTVTLGTAA